MKIVYRIERLSDGKGMYCIDDGRARSASSVFDFDSMRHPLPESDSLLVEAMLQKGVFFDEIAAYHFAFNSIDQLRSWIYQDDWLVGLHNLSMLLCEYTCREQDVLVGNTQVIFKGHLSKRQWNILEYFKLN